MEDLKMVRRERARKDRKMTLVVNKHTHEYDVYIGRGSVWGNSFPVGVSGTREEVIELYRQHLWEMIKRDDDLIDALIALEGQRLGCFCKPKACHGDVIVKAIEWAKAERELEAEQHAYKEDRL